MREFKKQLLQVIAGTLLLDAVVLIAAWLFDKMSLSFVLGLLVGSVFECVLFVSMIYSAQQTVSKTPGKGRAFYTVSYGLRFLASGLLMYAAIKLPFIDFWGVVIPLFYTKIIFVFIYTLGKESWR
ncbi:MAG: ATP synthase subunit I [Oscillospiraceae bacterium]|nr:ATP synthase subunit I [Oscillospiraceae bacterium]